MPKGDPLRLCHRRDRRLRPGLLGKTSLMFLVHPLSPPMKWPTSRGGASCGEPGLPVGLFAQTLRELMVAPLLATSAAGHWLAWSWKRSGGGAGWWLRSPRRLLIRCPRGTPPPEATPELLQGFDTVTQVTARANWLRHQPSPALPSAARAFALARPICLPPAPASTASFFAMPCASPSCAPPAAPALGWRPRLLPASGRIVGCRGWCSRRCNCD